MAGDVGDSEMSIKVMDILPNENRAVDPAEAVAALERLQKSTFHKFVSVTAQKGVKQVKEWCDTICGGEAPAFGADVLTPMLEKAKEMLVYFVQSKDDDGKVTLGRPAQTIILETVTSKVQKGEAVDREMLKPLSLCPWMLEEGERRLVDGWSLDIFKALEKEVNDLQAAEAATAKQALTSSSHGGKTNGSTAASSSNGGASAGSAGGPSPSKIDWFS